MNKETLYKFMIFSFLTIMFILIIKRTEDPKTLDSTGRLSGREEREPKHYEDPLLALSQDDPVLIDHIRTVIEAPTGHPFSPLWGQVPEEDSTQFGQKKELEALFRGKKNGTFIEVGAYDGQTFSNTLFLELNHGWSGLLIEPSHNNYLELKDLSRNSYSINCCLSVVPHAQDVLYRQQAAVSHVLKDTENRTSALIHPMKCFPLFSLMEAQDLTTLDLLSLDIEGGEVKVLQTIPWEEVHISVILVEFRHVPEGKDYLKEFLESQNYSFRSVIGDDYLFTRNDFIV